MADLTQNRNAANDNLAPGSNGSKSCRSSTVKHESEQHLKYPFTPSTKLPLEEIHRQRKELGDMQGLHREELAGLRKRHAAERETLRHGAQHAHRLVSELRAWSHEHEGRPL
jgi:hypothetical protein